MNFIVYTRLSCKFILRPSFFLFSSRSAKKPPKVTDEKAKQLHDELLSYTINNKQFMLQLEDDQKSASVTPNFGEMLVKIQSMPTQKLLSLINKSLFKGMLHQTKIDKGVYVNLTKQFMLIMAKSASEINYQDSVATLRLIKVLELEQGQKRLIQKLQKNIITSYTNDLKDVIKSIDRTKELFKLPSGELHKQMIKNVSDNFPQLDPVFHMQFIVYLIKEVNMVESPKLNKHEKELEQEILGYMELFINNNQCISLLEKASNDHKIKVIMMLCKFKGQDYVSQIVSPSMEVSHERQRQVIATLLIKMAEEFQYERVYSNLIINLANISYFVRNAQLTKLSLKPQFDEIFMDCASKISYHDLNSQNDLRLNRIIESVPGACTNQQFWHNLIQIQSERLKIYNKAADYKPYTSFSFDVHNKLFSATKDDEIKLKYLTMLLKKFLTEVKFMPVLTKLDLSNFLIVQGKQYPDVIFSFETKFLDKLFVYVIKEQSSLYFYKCIDILYVLQRMSQVRFIRTYAEFWYKIEDLLLRMKREFKVTQVVEIAELYSQMGRGSQIFWGEIEDYLLINSSEFKHLKDHKLIHRVIMAFHKVGRTNETFWKILSQLYEEFQSKYTFEEKLTLLNCFADHMPSMSLHLYKDFELLHLPKPTDNLRSFTIVPEHHLSLLNVIQKYQGYKSSGVIKDLNELLQHIILKGLTKNMGENQYQSQDKIIELASVIKNANNENLKSEVKKRFNGIIVDLIELGEKDKAEGLIKRYKELFRQSPPAAASINQNQ